MSKSVEDQLKELANSYKTITTTSSSSSSSTKISASVGKGGKNNKADVITVQTLLNKKGSNLTVDGSCGAKTIAAITAFQKQVVKIASPDGRIDPGGKTWTALSAGTTTATPTPTTQTPTPAPTTTTPTTTATKISASVGKDGKNNKADVITVQTLLNKKGTNLTVDGSCGAKTIAAITAFQKQVVKIASPDGRIDPGGKTWTALSGSSSSTATPTTPTTPSTGNASSGTGAKPGWLRTAESQIGIKETKGAKHNPEVVKYFASTPVAGAFKNDDDAWCSAFVFWCMKQNGVTGPTGSGGYDSVRALAWQNWGKKLSKPAYGCIGVMKRSGGGHVGFVTGASNGKITMLGGNQGDMVKYSNFSAGDFVAFVVPNNYEVPAAAYNLQAGNGSEGDSMR